MGGITEGDGEVGEVARGWRWLAGTVVEEEEAEFHARGQHL